MSCVVANVKVAHLRAGTPAYDNVAEWLADDARNAYVGRQVRVFITGSDGTKRRFVVPESPFANQFKAQEHGVARCIELYGAWLAERVAHDAAFRAALLALRGKVLGCWCAPAPCHAQVLCDYLNGVKLD